MEVGQPRCGGRDGGMARRVGWAAYYVYEAPTYQETFGALGMVMLIMTWFYLTAFAVLLGAEVNAELERQTTRNTSEEPARV